MGSFFAFLHTFLFVCISFFFVYYYKAQQCCLYCYVYCCIEQQYCATSWIFNSNVRLWLCCVAMLVIWQRHVAYVAMYIAILRSNIVCCKEPDAKIKRDPPQQTHEYEKRPMNIERDPCILLYCAAILCAFLCKLD